MDDAGQTAMGSNTGAMGNAMAMIDSVGGNFSVTKAALIVKVTVSPLTASPEATTP